MEQPVHQALKRATTGADVRPPILANMPRGRTQRSSVASVLALGFRIQQRRTYTFHDAVRDFGIGLRTYRRYLAILRASGMILDTERRPHANGTGFVRYLGYDHMFFDKEATNVA